MASVDSLDATTVRNTSRSVLAVSSRAARFRFVVFCRFGIHAPDSHRALFLLMRKSNRGLPSARVCGTKKPARTGTSAKQYLTRSCFLRDLRYDRLVLQVWASETPTTRMLARSVPNSKLRNVSSSNRRLAQMTPKNSLEIKGPRFCRFSCRAGEATRLIVFMQHLVLFVLLFAIDLGVFLPFGTQMRLPGMFGAHGAERYHLL